MHPERVHVRHAYASLDEMLSTSALAEILGRPIESVRREPFVTAGHSSTQAAFEAIYLGGDAHPSLITKTVARGKDWVAIATDDRVDREVWTWESGLLDRVVAPAAHAVLAGARTAGSYSVLMPDLSAHLLPDEGERSADPARQHLVVGALAALHAEFWTDELLDDAFYGLSSFARQISHGAPSTLEHIRGRMGSSAIVEWFDEGWAKLPGLVDGSVAADLRAIAEDPRPVVDAASRYPRTLIHADPRPANLAVDVGSRVVYFLDWARPAPAPPAYDLLYWLFTGNRYISVPRERLIDAYVAQLRRRLGRRFSDDWWGPQLALGFVAFLASFAPVIAQAMPDALGWWTSKARPGLAQLA